MRWLRKLFVRLSWVQDECRNAHQTGWHAGRSALLAHSGWKRWDWESPTTQTQLQVMSTDWREPETWQFPELGERSHSNFSPYKELYWKEVS